MSQNVTTPNLPIHQSNQPRKVGVWDGFWFLIFGMMTLVLFVFVFFVWHRLVPTGLDSIQKSVPIVKEVDFSYPVALPGAILTHTFIIKNNFNQLLYFDHIAVSCTCTSGRLGNSVLQPNEETNLTISTALLDFETTNLVNAGLYGHVGNQPVELRYILTRESAYPLKFSDKSDYFDFGTLTFGSAPQSYPPVTVSKGDLPMDWDNVTCNTDDPDLTADLTPLGQKNEKKWKLQLTYQPQADIGLVSPRLIFTLWKRGKPLTYQQTKLVNVDVNGPIYATPSSILIGGVAPNSVTIIPVTICKTDPRNSMPLKITQITYSDPRAVNASWTIENGNPMVKISYKAINAIGKQDAGQINVLVQGEQKYILRLSYMAMIMPPQTSATTQSN